MSFHIPRRYHAWASCLLVLAVLEGCGGSTEAPADDSAVSSAPVRSEMRAAAASGDVGTPAVSVVAAQTAPASLTTLSSTSKVLLDNVRPSSTCALAYQMPQAMLATTPAPISSSLMYDDADIAQARQQIAVGPFKSANDVMAGTPGEVARLISSAVWFYLVGESPIAFEGADARRATHGSRARDASFIYLLYPSEPLRGALRNYLLQQASFQLNDFSALFCLRNADGSVRDAWFGEATWLARYIATYDAARRDLADSERLTIENFIRRNAYFLAAQIDYGLSLNFPDRLTGSYARKRFLAAPATEAETWASRRVDTNGDCKVDAADAPGSIPVYAYARADGSAGPRLSVLSQAYNNRRSSSALAVGAAGLLLGDRDLTLRAERYFMEWLTFAVWPDGSEGEYLRNGDYCVAGQGVIYGASNIQGAVLLADMAARLGDRTLFEFTTRDGLFGSEAKPTDAPKSLALVARTHFELATGRRQWYFHRSDLATQVIGPETSLGAQEIRIDQAIRPTDEFHLLGLVLAQKHFPELPLRGFVLRSPEVTSLHFPGSTGNAVATGFGSWVGAWTDTFNLYGSALIGRAH